MEVLSAKGAETPGGPWCSESFTRDTQKHCVRLPSTSLSISGHSSDPPYLVRVSVCMAGPP